jgi:hypothetical protein
MNKDDKKYFYIHHINLSDNDISGEQIIISIQNNKKEMYKHRTERQTGIYTPYLKNQYFFLSIYLFVCLFMF